MVELVCHTFDEPFRFVDLFLLEFVVIVDVLTTVETSPKSLDLCCGSVEMVLDSALNRALQDLEVPFPSCYTSPCFLNDNG